jgi:hypothetical protein
MENSDEEEVEYEESVLDDEYDKSIVRYLEMMKIGKS